MEKAWQEEYQCSDLLCSHVALSGSAVNTVLSHSLSRMLLQPLFVGVLAQWNDLHFTDK